MTIPKWKTAIEKIILHSKARHRTEPKPVARLVALDGEIAKEAHPIHRFGLREFVPEEAAV